MFEDDDASPGKPAAVDEDAADEGVGERAKRSMERGPPGDSGYAELSLLNVTRFGVDALKTWWAGKGVETPSAFASFARRWGARGASGAARGTDEDEDAALEGRGGGIADDRGVSSSAIAIA